MTTNANPPESIITENFDDALSKRYLAYALSTIMSRALPDVRDGLKPVHRRLLYAMYELKLNPKSSFKKSARVVGDVMGKFHPHGDAAIYDALVRLAQDFSVRYPLIDGQGNFGNIDGDNAAAMRYTEARLTEMATFLFQGIDDETVDFLPTYDGEEEEPAILPAGFPNILANGASGIAVGMATSIPPHNLYELCQGLKHLLDHPDADDEALLDYIPGPDFPTGGLLIEGRASILQAYETGRGSFRLRAHYEVEQQKGGSYRIAITEIPYQVQKSKLLEKMADLLHQKKLPLIQNILDESAEDVRIVIEPKSRNIPAEHVMESLFIQTDLDVRISLNMNVISLDRRPEVLSLKQVLSQFLTHRLIILKKHTECRLRHIGERLHLLAGLLIAYLNLDDVIDIIRNSDEPKQELMARFSLSDIQAEAILNMRLRSLRKLQEIELKTEHDSLEKEKEKLLHLLGSETAQKKTLKKECDDIAKVYGMDTPIGKRRTRLGVPPTIIDRSLLEPAVDVEPVTIICSKMGWIRLIKGHVEAADVTYKEGDEARFFHHTKTNEKIVMMSNRGRAFTLSLDKLTIARGNSKNQGDGLRLLIDLPKDDDITVFIPLERNDSGVYRDYILVNNRGRGFQIKGEHLLSQTKQGKQIMNCQDEDTVMYVEAVTQSHLALLGNHRKLLMIAVEDIPFLVRGQGVTLQKYKDAILSDVKQLDPSKGLTYRRGLQVVVEKNLSPWIGKRGSIGRLAPLGFPRTNTFEM